MVRVVVSLSCLAVAVIFFGAAWVREPEDIQDAWLTVLGLLWLVLGIGLLLAPALRTGARNVVGEWRSR